jgi:hypothetical protein
VRHCRVVLLQDARNVLLRLQVEPARVKHKRCSTCDGTHECKNNKQGRKGERAARNKTLARGEHVHKGGGGGGRCCSPQMNIALHTYHTAAPSTLRLEKGVGGDAPPAFA